MKGQRQKDNKYPCFWCGELGDEGAEWECNRAGGEEAQWKLEAGLKCWTQLGM